jgi:ABC-type transporter Mla subunit MlaD
MYLAKRDRAQLDRIEEHLHTILRRLHRMAIDEAAFDSALAEFVTTLDSTLDAIKAKLDSLDVPATDFTDELATLDAAKERLSSFVADNAGADEPPAEEAPPA